MKRHVNTVDFTQEICLQLLAENVIRYTRVLLLTCKLQEAGDGKGFPYIYFRAKYLIFPALFQIKSLEWRMIKDTKGYTIPQKAQNHALYQTQMVEILFSVLNKKGDQTLYPLAIKLM